MLDCAVVLLAVVFFAAVELVVKGFGSLHGGVR